MRKVVFLVSVAVVTVSSDPQSSSAFSASSASSCSGGSCAQSAAASSAAAASGASSCGKRGDGGGRCGNSPQRCGPNETFDSCPATCPPQQCGVDPALILCAPNPEYGDPECKPGCRCIDGYLRDENNECIPKDSCPKPDCNGDPNASPGCGVNCGRTCATYNSSEPVFCTDICYENGCDCNKDYVFDEGQRKCVLPQDCSCNGDPNAVPGCGVNCGRTCDTYNKGPQACILICYENACDCKKDYVFDDIQRKCVLPQDCSCNGDPNARPGCGVNCGRTCDTYNSSEPVFCPAICYENACDCKKNFVFDGSLKKCVLPQDCTPKCGPNEVPSNCSNGGCGPFTCADLGSPIKCVRPQKCEVGCVCRNNYVRNANGTCVPKNQCPAPKCGPNQNCRCRPRYSCQKGFAYAQSSASAGTRVRN